jgi:hypothetical protein
MAGAALPDLRGPAFTLRPVKQGPPGVKQGQTPPPVFKPLPSNCARTTAFPSKLPPNPFEPCPRSNRAQTRSNQVNYVGKGANLYEDGGYKLSGAAYVVEKYLGTSWLWDRVGPRCRPRLAARPAGRRVGLALAPPWSFFELAPRPGGAPPAIAQPYARNRPTPSPAVPPRIEFEKPKLATRTPTPPRSASWAARTAASAPSTPTAASSPTSATGVGCSFRVALLEAWDWFRRLSAVACGRFSLGAVGRGGCLPAAVQRLNVCACMLHGTAGAGAFSAQAARTKAHPVHPQPHPTPPHQPHPTPPHQPRPTPQTPTSSTPSSPTTAAPPS